MLRLITILFVIGLLLSAWGQSFAVPLDPVIYDNGGPDPFSFALFSDFDPIIVTNELASDFSLDPGEFITDFHWWGKYSDLGYGGGDEFVAVDDFSIRIFPDDGGVPAANPLVGGVFNVGNNVNRTLDATLGIYGIYEYSAFITPFFIAPDTTYWLSIVNNTVGDVDGWFWDTTGVLGNDATRVDGGAWGTVSSFELAYQITGNVPEPATLMLLGSGLLGLVGLRKKFQKL